MALVATEPLYIGTTVAALPGTLVAPEAVEKYGWGDKVKDDGKGATAQRDESAETTTKRGSKK